MKSIRYIFCILAVIIVSSCSESILDKKPMDKLDADALLTSPEGRLSYLANLYYQLPIEDFLFCFKGFNWRGNNNGKYPAYSCDEAIHSEARVRGFLHNQNELKWWDDGYQLIRDVNLLEEYLPSLDIDEKDKTNLIGETAFIRAFAYYGLAKRYGGVPLIKEVQYFEGDLDAIKVPRSTEKQTWDYVLEECDRAIANLPETWFDEDRRATKWAAYALKSRAALHAASLCKYWANAPLSGPAVDQGLVGMSASDANTYYDACITACQAIMSSGEFSLHGENPSSPEEAAENYREMFEDPGLAPEEVIFLKGFSIPGYGHHYDFWLSPNQTSNGAPHPGRMNPSLEHVDCYESYDNPGVSSPIVTTVDGDVNNYNGFDPARTYLRFDEAYEIFEGKDARLWGTAVLPGTTWKNTKIIIQGGYIQPDGTAVIESDASIDAYGQTWYTYGAADYTDFSGFKILGGRMTQSGFSFKKFLSQNDIPPELNQSTNDWIEFRYGEILLNFAEAVVESGHSAAAEAAQALNSLRRRAGHTVDIPLTLDNVRRERRVELAFENNRNWDLNRWRLYHSELHNTVRHALVPVLDLRVNPPQYIFIRQIASRERYRTYLPREYYRPIPDVSASGLVQNPEW
jgi:hypothetical protein